MGPVQPPALGVYVHIPFCVAKCAYCDFVSVPLAPGRLDPYLAAIAREIASAPEAGRRVSTVFVGGGTPSLLGGGQLAALLEAVRRSFDVGPDAEITIEANPGTLTPGKVRDYLASGVNRVSLGVQSLDDALLKRLGRRHTAGEALAAYGLLRGAGCDNVGLDLIHGLPGQTPAAWHRDLARAIALGPEHLSLYALGVEKGTVFAAERLAGRLELPAEADEVEMLALSRELTAGAGYERYEISNWARPGFPCRHNIDCWSLGEYAGFGAGAHSFVRRDVPLRLSNVADVAAYVRLAGAGEPAVSHREEPGPRRLAGEALMLGLRTAAGVDEGAFAVAHGAPPTELFPEALALGASRGWTDREGGRLRFTDSGFLFSDSVFRLLF